jgi:hypothetical protein
MSHPERRAFVRYPAQLPLEYGPAEDVDPPTYRRTVTQDVSSGGVRFLSAGLALHVGSLLNLRFTAPPGAGHYPAEVDLTGTGRVLRLQPAVTDPASPPHISVAAEFTSPLRLAMPDV